MLGKRELSWDELLDQLSKDDGPVAREKGGNSNGTFEDRWSEYPEHFTHINMDETGLPIRSVGGIFSAMEMAGMKAQRAAEWFIRCWQDGESEPLALNEKLTEEQKVRLSMDGHLHPRWREWDAGHRVMFPISASETERMDDKATIFRGEAEMAHEMLPPDHAASIALVPPSKTSGTAEFQSMLAGEKPLRGAPVTADEWSEIQDERLGSRNATDLGGSKVNIRFDMVKTDTMDAAEVYFDFLKTSESNANILSGDDSPTHVFIKNGDIAHRSFIDVLRHAGIFAFPHWWYDVCTQMCIMESAVDQTAGMTAPVPRLKYSDPGAMVRFMRAEDLFELISTEDERVERSRRLWAQTASTEFPEELPFKQTFVGFEWTPVDGKRPLNGGHLIYQKGQTSMCARYSCPTSAYTPEGKLVPLDVIYLRGYLLDETGSFWPEGAMYDKADDRTKALRGSKTIWGLFHGYVISEEHCPDDMKFLRIQIAVPVYMGFLEWDSRDVDENSTFFGVEGKMCWSSAFSYIARPLSCMMAAIDDHRVVQHKFGKKHKKKRALVKQDGIGVSQKRYQRVQMSSGPSLKRRGDGDSIGVVAGRKLMKRIRVRSHERVFIRAGLKPISHEDRRALMTRGYRVYSDPGTLTPADARRLMRRARKRPGLSHWVAIKDTRIVEHHKGPEGAEVVPVVHVTDERTVAGSLEWELSDAGSMSSG